MNLQASKPLDQYAVYLVNDDGVAAKVPMQVYVPDVCKAAVVRNAKARFKRFVVKVGNVVVYDSNVEQRKKNLEILAKAAKAREVAYVAPDVVIGGNAYWAVLDQLSWPGKPAQSGYYLMSCPVLANGEVDKAEAYEAMPFPARDAILAACIAVRSANWGDCA